MKAFYYKINESLLLLTPKAYKKIKSFTNNALVSKNNGFFLVRFACPFAFDGYKTKDKLSFCSDCKKRLKKEMGGCGYKWSPEHPERYSIESIILACEEKSILSDESIYREYLYLTYDNYEYQDMDITLSTAVLILLMLPFIFLFAYAHKGYSFVTGLFQKEEF